MVPTLTVPVVEPHMHITDLLTPQFVCLLVYTVGSGLAVVGHHCEWRQCEHRGRVIAGWSTQRCFTVPLILSAHFLTLASPVLTENAYSKGGAVSPRPLERNTPRPASYKAMVSAIYCHSVAKNRLAIDTECVLNIRRTRHRTIAWGVHRSPTD